MNISASSRTDTIGSAHTEAEPAGERGQLHDFLALGSQGKLDDIVVGVVAVYGEALQGESDRLVENFIL